MVALTAAEKTAFTSFLKTKRQQKGLSGPVVDALVAYFAAKGTPVNEVATAVPHGASATEVEELRDVWKEFAVAAGITDVPDINSVGRWITAPEGPGRSARAGKAAAVADVLVRKGLAVDRETEQAIHGALVAADKGELDSQCSCVEVIWVLYTGQSPGEEDRTWFEEKRAASIMARDGLYPRVDIRAAKSYSKQHVATSMATLERALIKDKSGGLWASYYLSTINKLQNLGYSAAVARFIGVCGFAKRMSQNQVQRELDFLYNYFFEEYRGCGMPVEQCTTCALTLGVPVDKQLTVPEEDVLYRQQQHLMGHWAGPRGMQAQYAGAEAQQQAQIQQLQSQLQQWQYWQHQQQGQQQPWGAPPVQPTQPEDPPGPDKSGCSFCGSKAHDIEKCSEMHKARADRKKVKQAEKKILEEAQKAAREAAALGGAPP